jgi:hypothetical protein
MPKLHEIIERKTKSPTKKTPQWLITKFRKLKEHIDNTGKKDLKIKDTHNQMKIIAKNLGHMELFEEKNKETNFKSTPHKTSMTKSQSLPESLQDEFNKNQDETTTNVFDLETMQEGDKHTSDFLESLGQESDTSDMPDLEINESVSDDGTGTQEEARQLKDIEDYDIHNAEQSSEDTDGAHYYIEQESKQDKLEQKQRNDEVMFELDTSSHTEEDLLHDTNQDSTTQNIQTQIRNAEKVLDKEVKEVQDIHLHTPKIQRNQSYEEEDSERMDRLALKQFRNNGR